MAHLAAYDVHQTHVSGHCEPTTGIQVEIYFSAVQRKALTPDDSFDLDQIEQRLLSLQSRHNTTARPFGWTCTRHAPQPLAA